MNAQELKVHFVQYKTFPHYAWPGGYPVFFLARDNEILCPACAEAIYTQWASQGYREKTNEEIDQNDNEIGHFDYEIPIASGIHWEGDPLFCSDCNGEIESAYGPLEDES